MSEALRQEIKQLRAELQEEREERKQLKRELDQKVDQAEYRRLKREHEQALDKIGQLEQENEQQQATIDQQAEQLKDQAKQVEQLESELSDATDHSGKERAELAGRVSEIEQTLEDADLSDQTPTPERANTGMQQNELTPIEQLARSDDISDVTDSQSVRRAVTLFKHLTDWGSKTPKGFVLKPADNPLKLLEADQDESLAWKQYYRAAEALERLSHGSVTFFDSDRHGKMICLHEQSEAFERVVNGSLSPSSVGAST